MKKIKKKMNNIVIIGSRNNPEICEHAILIRMNSAVYKDYGCIKIQVIASLLEFAEVLIKRWKSAGLNEVSRVKKPIKTLKGYTLPDAYEITLRKIPVLEMMKEEGVD